MLKLLDRKHTTHYMRSFQSAIRIIRAGHLACRQGQVLQSRADSQQWKVNQDPDQKLLPMIRKNIFIQKGYELLGHFFFK